MALEITLLDNQVGDVSPLVADRRLLLTADNLRVVEDHDPEGRYLLVGKGCEVNPREVERLGLVKVGGRVEVKKADGSTPVMKPEPPAEPEPDLKEKAQPEDKELEKPADKSRFKRRKKK